MKPKTVQTLHDTFNQVRNDLLLAIFNEIIRPVVDRYDWEIAWAMGCVWFNNDTEVVDLDNKTISKMEETVREITENIYPRSQCSGIWDVLSSLHPAGSYHKSHGQFKDFNERIRKRVHK